MLHIRLDVAVSVYTICGVKIEYDAAKNSRNIELRGLSFDLVEDFDLATAMIVDELRGNPPELRLRALGVMAGGNRVHALVFTLRGDAPRVISFRKANRREVRIYEAFRESRTD